MVGVLFHAGLRFRLCSGRKHNYKPSLCCSEGFEDGFVIFGFMLLLEGIVRGIGDDDVVEEV